MTYEFGGEPITPTSVFHIKRLNRAGKQATLKTGEISERPVPIHNAVLSENFLEYVAQIKRDYYGGGAGPLFRQFQLWRGRLNHDANQRLMKWLRREAKINPPRKTFTVGGTQPK